MWREHNMEAPNYRRISYVWQQHVARFVRYVEAHGVPCQECGGRGGYVEVICDGQGPFETCGFCEGTGRTTRHLKGLWLRWKRDEKRKRADQVGGGAHP